MCQYMKRQYISDWFKMILQTFSRNTLVRTATFVLAFLNLCGSMHFSQFTIYQSALRVQLQITQYTGKCPLFVAYSNCWQMTTTTMMMIMMMMMMRMVIIMIITIMIIILIIIFITIIIIIVISIIVIIIIIIIFIIIIIIIVITIVIVVITNTSSILLFNITLANIRNPNRMTVLSHIMFIIEQNNVHDRIKKHEDIRDTNMASCMTLTAWQKLIEHNISDGTAMKNEMHGCQMELTKPPHRLPSRACCGVLLWVFGDCWWN